MLEILIDVPDFVKEESYLKLGNTITQIYYVTEKFVFCSEQCLNSNQNRLITKAFCFITDIGNTSEF